MSESAGSPFLQQFIAMLREHTGNIVAADRYAFVEEIAERRARATGHADVAGYVRSLALGTLPGEWDCVVSLVTIKESYFFRAPQQFEALRQKVLPRLLRARAGSRRLRIWSAACARGEEPATLALVLAEERALAGWDWSIVATDIDAEALAGAQRGLYGDRAIAQVPKPLLDRYFSRRGKLHELSPELLAHIDYRRLNLAHPPYELPESEFDLVFLRNILIYFRRPLQVWVTEQVGSLLARRGALFLGASETLWQIQDELEAVDLGDCFCYRHRRGRTERSPLRGRPRSIEEVDLPPLPAEPAPEPEPPPAPRPLRPRPEPVIAEPEPPAAEPALPAAKPASAPRPSLSGRLSAAAHDLAENRVEEATEAARQALDADPGEPAAHVLIGFLHDLAGRADEAVTAYRAALYLDPTLFQPRLLLADCLLRLGQRERALHQYREVLSILGGGRERAAELLAALPLPDRERAERRCRQALHAAPRQKVR